jgi:imidazolonepropionase-like amidohydrolase
MKITRLLVSLTLALLMSTAFLAQENAPSSQRPIAFVNVSVIDATGSPAQPDMTVVVSGNRISELGPAGKVAVPNGAQVVNAKGQFLIPGLWDMHTHAFMRKHKMLPQLTMNLFLANGVTGIRDMGDQGVRDDLGDFPYAIDFEWRTAVTTGVLSGPRMSLAGVIIDGPKSPRAGWASIHTEAEARALVISLKKLGADYIKPYDRLPRDAYFALADEAKKQGLDFAGHTPFAISAAEASDAGQHSIEHLTGVLMASSRQDEEFRKAILAGQNAPSTKVLVDTYDEAKAKNLFARFVKNGTYHCPTLIRGRLEPVPMSDPRIARYFTPRLREEYEPSLKSTPESQANRTLNYEINQRLVREMHRAGVKMLAGTDTRFFGSDVHAELAEFVKAGLTPMEALQTATRNAAQYLGALDKIGTVEKGKLADLVLLEANPLTAIANVSKIRAVVVNGRLVDRPELDRLLAQVESAGNKVQMKPIE